MKPVHSAAQRAAGKIKATVPRLAGRYPFHARVLEQFKLTCMPGVGTMGVTVRSGELLLLYAPRFVLKTPARQLGGVLLHEVHHVVLNHLTADPADFPDQWARTVAEEVTVNEFVKEPLPEGGITLERFPWLPPMESTAQRYERLKAARERIRIVQPSSSLPSQGGGGNAGTGEAPSSGESSPAGGEAQPGQGQLLDNHEVWREALQDPQAALEVIRDALLQAACEVGTSGLAGALAEAVRGLGLGVGVEAGEEEYRLRGDRDGRLDWRHLLRLYLGQELEPQASLARPPRRFPRLVGIVPARQRRPERARVLAIIDTSGSISDELLELIDGELRRLAACHEVTVVECDTVIHRVERYRRLESVTGRGGTDFRPPLETAFLRQHRPGVVVYFTDGFGPAPESAPCVPVIWCLVPGGESPAPWGRVIPMEPSQGT